MAYTGYQGPWNFKKPAQPAGFTQPTQALPFTLPTQPSGPTPVYKYRSPNQPGAFNYNDPYEINSVADVILKTLNPSGKNPLQYIATVANPINIISETVPDLIDLFKRGTVDPLSRGDLNAFKDNFLINLNETLGIAGNPIKALLMGKGIGGVQDALGFGENGRKNFDWNTGNVFSDIALEFASDPFTWITLGASAASHAIATGAEKAAVAAGDVALDATEHAALKRLTSKAINSYLRGDSRSVAEAMTAITDSLNKPNTLHLLTNFSHVDLGKIVNMAGEISQQLTANTVLKSIRGITSASEAVQRGLMDSVLTTSGILPAYKLTQGLHSLIKEANMHRTEQVLHNYTVPNTNTVDTFRLPDMVHDFQDQTVVLDSASQYVDEAGIDPSIFKVQMQKEITTQLSNIDTLVEKNAKDPDALNQALCTYLGHDSPDILQDYHNNLVANNTRQNGAFDRQIAELESIMNRKSNLEYNSKVKNASTTLQTVGKQIDSNVDFIFNTMRNPAAPNSPTQLVSEILQGAKANPNIYKQLRRSGGTKAELNETIRAALDNFRADMLNQTNTGLYETKLNQIDKLTDVWHNLGVDLPEHNTLTQIFQNYKKSLLDAINPDKTVKQQQAALKQLVLTGNITKDALHKYAQRINSTSYSDPYSTNMTSPRISDLQLKALDVIQKNSKIPYVNSVRPVDVNSFKKLQSDSLAFFTGNMDPTSLVHDERIPEFFDAFKNTFQEFDLTKPEFEQSIKGFLHLVDAAIVSPEQFLGTTGVQNLYRRAWNRYQQTIQSMLAVLPKDPEAYKNLRLRLKSLLIRTKAMNPVMHQQVILNVAAASRLQKLQLDKSYVAEMLLASPQTRTLREVLNGTILNNTETGKLINAYVRPDTDELTQDSDKGLDYLCRIVSQYSQTTKNYRLLSERVNNSTTLEPLVKAAFKSTLQTFGGIRSKDFLSWSEWFLSSAQNDQNLFSKIESLINVSKMQGSLSLDSLAKHFGIVPEKAHTAASDINTLEQIIEKSIAENFQDPGVTYVLVDIETTGLSAYQNSTLEIAYKVLGDKNVTSLTRAYDDLNSFDVPNSAVLNTFFPGIPENQQRELFQKRYAKGLKESDMYSRFNSDLQALGSNVKLVYHNGDRFDLAFQKWRASKDQQYFTTLSHEDTLKLLRKKCNYFALTQEERNELTAQMHEYATLQYNVSPNARLVQIPDQTLLDALKKISKNAQFKTTAVYQAAQELGDFYTNVKAQNELIGSQLMDSNAFNAGQDYDYFKQLGFTVNQTLIEDIEKNPDFYASKLKMSKDEFMDWTKYMHQFKLLYGLDDSSNIFAFSYRNITDLNKMSNWFNMDLHADENLVSLEKTTRFAQNMERARNLIRNIVPIEQLSQQIQHSFQQFLSEMQFQLKNGTPEMYTLLQPYQLLKTDLTNPLEQFIVLREARKLPAFEKFIAIQQMNPAVVSLCEDHAGLLNHPVLKDTELTYMQTLENIDDTVMFDDVDKLDRVLADFEAKTIDPLKTLSESMDVNKIVSANALIQAQNLRPFAELLRNYSDTLRSFETYEQKADFVREIQTATNKLAAQQVQQLAALTPELLHSLMLYDAPFIMFNIDEKLMDKSFTDSIQNFLKNKKLYSDAGIEVIVENDPVTANRKLYLTLNLTENQPTYFLDNQTKTWVCSLNGQTVGRPIFETNLDLFKNYSSLRIGERLSDVQAKLHYLSAQRSAGTLGDLMDSESILKMYQNLPESVQKFLPSLDTLLDQEFWQTTHYNFVNIGSLESRKSFQPGYPNTILSLLKTSATKTSVTATTVLSRLEAYFNPAFSINNGLLATPEYGEAMIESLRNHPEYTLSALVEDKKTGYRIELLDPSRKDILPLARQLNAVIMPYHIYSKLSTVLNQQDYSNKFMKIWNQLLYAYKTGCLLDPGVFFRNEIDSTIKVMVTTRTGIETIVKKSQARNMLKEFDDAYRQILNMSKLNISALEKSGVSPEDISTLLQLQDDAKAAEAKLVIYDILNRYDLDAGDIMKMDTNKAYLEENKKYFFEKLHPASSEASYDITDTFIKNASAGMTKAMEEHMLDKNLNNASGNILWNSFLKYSNKLMHPNAIIDQVNRFAQYLIHLERGQSTTEAFYEVARTHFDYANKSRSERIAELIFPFYTFKMRNLEYWVDAAMHNAWVWTMFSDIMRPIWNFDDTTPKELHYNKSLQYQILAGNIPLGNGLILKTAPSMMDAFNLVSDPVNSLKSSLVTPLDSVTNTVLGSIPDSAGSRFLKNALSIYNTPNTYGAEQGISGSDLLNIGAMLPVIGPTIQRYGISGPKNAARSGSVLPLLMPGIFGATSDPNSGYIHPLKPPAAGKTHYARGYYPYSKHPRANRSMRKNYKSYAKRTYARKSYAYRVYADKVYPTRVFTPKAYAHNVPTQFTYYPGYYTNFYTKLYTKQGESRFKLRSKLASPQNLYTKLQDQYYNYRP